jgi:type I restriction enzyme, S subunit
MQSEWAGAIFDELKSSDKQAFAMGPFGSRIKAENFVTSGVPVIKGANLNGDFLLEDKFDFLTEEKAAELSSSVAKELDLVITHRGTIGQVGIIRENARYQRYIVSQSQLKLSFDRKQVNPYFIYYFLRSPEGQRRLLMNASQVGVPAIAQALTSIRNISVPLPTVEEQNAITETLLSIDDQIGLNRQINKTIEAIAQSLFKSWFIDFDPVKAKMDGRQPEAMDEATAALFPSEFKESAIGLIPKGWHINRISDLMELAYGKALKASNRIPGDIPVYGSGGVTGFHNVHLVDGPSVIVGRKGTVGSLYWEDRPFFPIDTVFYVKPKSAPLTFCYELLKAKGLNHMNTDAAVPGLNRENVYRLEVVAPPLEILEAFDGIVSSLRRMAFANTQEAQRLTEIRDSLLPKLMSGQLRIPETKSGMNEVAA